MNFIGCLVIFLFVEEFSVDILYFFVCFGVYLNGLEILNYFLRK